MKIKINKSDLVEDPDGKYAYTSCYEFIPESKWEEMWHEIFAHGIPYPDLAKKLTSLNYNPEKVYELIFGK